MRTDGRWEVADTADVVARVRSLRDRDAPFDVAVPGESNAGDPRRLEEYTEHERAGATWWVEAIHPWRFGWRDDGGWPLIAMQERIDAGR
jgi:hypothetical protein